MRGKTSRNLSWLLLVLLATVSVRAEVPLVQRIEDKIRAAEPGWQCTHGFLNAPPSDVPSERLLVASRWEHALTDGNTETVDLKLFQVDSLPDAIMSLQSMREKKVAPEWKVKPFSMGDEAYLATFRNGSRYEIHFRKKTIVVRVSSDSIRQAERFAKYAEDQI